MARTRGAPNARRVDAPRQAPTPTNIATSDGSSDSRNRSESQGGSARRIVIRSEAFGCGYDIVIEPPAAWAHYDQERPTIRAARRYAESLKIVNPSWKIDDQSGEPA
jgi:hypothetical protein